ncbi:MAG: hypothetical protein ACTJIB_12715 [Pseudoalteromonas prydzensis]|uniref:hypothetical protein n=1 Tax=Pseudoalteromonas prydzensis TaxID=182141 RepID=UPI003F960B78
MVISPLIYIKCLMALFCLLSLLIIFFKRHSIEKIAQSLITQQLTMELLRVESQMKLLPICDEKTALFERCLEIKNQIRLSAGIPKITVSNKVEITKEADNVISLHEKRLKERRA